ncbi:MAG: hypothetical protein IJ379_11065 [Lachnospiraceae bacterium]|nr:hypothetical protein [Lachnospiraceae bacterium]
MKSKRLRVGLIIVSIVLILFVGFCIYYKLFMDPYRGSMGKNAGFSRELDEMLSADEAKEDLAYMMERFRGHHPAWLENFNARVVNVEAQYNAEIENIEGEISVLELYQIAGRIASELYDGHTYPYWKGEEVLYIDDFTQVNMHKPVTIDGRPIDEVCQAYKEVSSYEVDFYAEEVFWANVLVNEYALRLCGVDTSDGVTMTFQEGEEVVEYHYDFVPIQEVNGYEYSEEEQPWVYYEIDKENNVGIFTLTTCVDNEEYRKVLENFFKEVFSEDIENVVVDLRWNGGGNSWVANEFIKYLDVEEYKSWDCQVRFGWYLFNNRDITYKNQKKQQVFDGELYVLTNVKTYSAAMDFAMLIADNDLGTIVGEASGNLPDSYGDIVYFQMPNSKLMLCVSHKRWYRIDQTKSGEPIMPDYEVESSEALEKVYELIGAK